MTRTETLLSPLPLHRPYEGESVRAGLGLNLKQLTLILQNIWSRVIHVHLATLLGAKSQGQPANMLHGHQGRALGNRLPGRVCPQWPLLLLRDN